MSVYAVDRVAGVVEAAVEVEAVVPVTDVQCSPEEIAAGLVSFLLAERIPTQKALAIYGG
jgi:hypothetical protein